MRERYFDNAATSPLDPKVLEAMLPFLGEEFGNASSIHGWGLRAMAAVDEARASLARLIGAQDPSQIVFTSGATEANNWVLARFSSIAISPFEHEAVIQPAAMNGAAVLPNRGTKLLEPNGHFDLMSVMAVNNEIGTRWNAAAFRENAGKIHSDITQAVGKLPIELEGIDYASMSAHKFYGPKGVGALYFRDQPLDPFILGGAQQHGMRGGTLNVPGIVGMGKAAELAAERLETERQRAKSLSQLLLHELRDCPDWRVNGGDDRSPFILSLSFAGIQGESLVIELDQAGFAVSSGAACSSGSTDPSHVLLALGIEEQWLRGTIRVSFGRFNDEDSTSKLARVMLLSVEKLRKML